jgi:hypothetical protein
MCRSVEMVLEFIPRFCGLSALKFLLESSTIYVHTPSLLLLGVRVLKVLHWMRNDIISRDNSHLISCFVRLSWNFKYKSFAEIQVFFFDRRRIQVMTRLWGITDFFYYIFLHMKLRLKWTKNSDFTKFL